MGTRNSTLVKLDGEIKVAQYGQWDGYPTWQGLTIQKFLQEVDLEKFKEKLRTSVKPVDEKEVEKYIKEELGAENGWLNMDQAAKFNKRFPALSRDHGADILNIIYNGESTEIRLDPDFKNDTLFCEYWYEIDLDREVVTMNGKGYTFKEWTQDGFMEKLEEQEREDE